MFPLGFFTDHVILIQIQIQFFFFFFFQAPNMNVRFNPVSSLLLFHRDSMQSNQRALVNIWIPSAFLRGKGGDAYHVYQVRQTGYVMSNRLGYVKQARLRQTGYVTSNRLCYVKQARLRQTGFVTSNGLCYVQRARFKRAR